LLPRRTLTWRKTRVVSITKFTIGFLRVLADAGKICGEGGREGRGRRGGSLLPNMSHYAQQQELVPSQYY
jgi:hypothetical protein